MSVEFIHIDKIKYYKSAKWNTISTECKKLAGNKCVICGSIEHLHAHHLTYKNLGDEEQADLQCVCHSCHEAIHGFKFDSHAKTQGTRKMKMKDYCTMQEQVVKSTQDLKIWNLLINSHKKDGSVKDRTDFLSVNGLAKHFECSRQNISSFIRRSKQANFIQVRNRIIYINPFVSIPYAISDTDLYEIQTKWTEFEDKQSIT
jgi:hypothetical protein